MLGTRIANRYDVLGELGRGGMGVVYRAHDPLLDRDVAIKLIPPHLLTDENESRFQREAQLVAQMDHPSIISIYDFGRHERSLYFVMPLVRGNHLRVLFKQKQLTVADILDIGSQVAEALDYSHSRGVVHRDIKPENIMLTRDTNGTNRVRVMDFGLATTLSADRITNSGTLIGTFAYLSPEQVAGNEAQPRSDVYALGVVLYEALCGETPFRGDVPNMLYEIAHQPARSLRECGVTIDDDLDSVILSCLAKNVDDRPRRASHVADALRSCALRLRGGEAPPRVRPVSGKERRRAELPLIGRDSEIEAITERLQRAIHGEAQLVLLGGETGVGKSRLAEEIGSIMRNARGRTITGRIVDQELTFPYQVFISALQDLSRVIEQESEPSITELWPELVAIFPILGDLAPAPLRSVNARAAAKPRITERSALFELLGKAFSRIADTQPLALILENLHSADVSIEALRYLMQRLAGDRVLIVGTYRSDEVDRRHPLTSLIADMSGDGNFLDLHVAPLTRETQRELVSAMLGNAAVSETLVEAIDRVTEGNPLFTRELVRSLREGGTLSSDARGTLQLTPETDLGETPLPTTIQQIVERRLARLSDAVRETLSLAAVFGRSCDVADLTAVAQSDEVEDHLDALIANGLLEDEAGSRGKRLAFSSGVVREVVYAALSRARRRTYHRRIGEFLEWRYSGRLERVYPMLAYHFSRAFIAEKAVTYSLSSARTSLAAFSGDDAARDARIALDYLDGDDWTGDPSLEGEAHLLLAEALRMKGNAEAALQSSERAVRAFERTGNEERMAAAFFFAAETAWQARHAADASRYAESGIFAARRCGNEEMLSRLLELSARLANLRGDIDRATRLSEEASHLLSAARDENADAATTRSGTVVVPIGGGVLRSLDPARVTIREHAEVLPTIFETLTRVSKGGRAVPWLASGVEREDNGASYRFTLREGVTFHDGRPLSSADVKHSFERVLRSGEPSARRLLSAIEGADEAMSGTPLRGLTITSDRQFVIRLQSPIAFFPELLSDAATAILPAQTETIGGSWREGCAGTGPFRVVRFVPGETLQLEANPAYWRKGYPRSEGLVFNFGVAPDDILENFRAGRFHVASDLAPAHAEALRHDASFAAGYRETPRLSTYWLAFNCRQGRFSDAVARHRIASLIETASLVEEHLGRLAVPAKHLVPPDLLEWPSEAPRPRRIIAADETTGDTARLRTGIDPRFHSPADVTVAISPVFVGAGQYGDFARALYSVLASAGLRVRVINSSAAELFDALANGTVDLVLARWAADYPDADSFIHGMLEQRSGFVGKLCGSDEIDALIRRARSETDLACRHAIYLDIEALLHDRTLLLPLFHEQVYRFARPNVRGLSSLNFLEPVISYEDLRVVG